MVTLSLYKQKDVPGENLKILIPGHMPVCPCCENTASSPPLVLYDYVRRKGREKNNTEIRYLIPRGKCPICHTLHRMLPAKLIPYKHYHAEYIAAAIRSNLPAPAFIVSQCWWESPAEITVERWRLWAKQNRTELNSNPLYARLSKNA